MHDATDMDLLRQYAEGNSDAAFATLVSRHINLVYSAALRKTGNPHAAEDITQAVFIILAQKAGRIPAKTILPGWLYQTARLTASSFLRGEIRRVRREQEAYMQTEPSAAAPDETWEQLAPLLEDAMGQLGNRDRAAVVLRFFGGKSFAEVAVAAGVSENAAKKRVAHALEQLHRYFSKRGVSSTTAIIAGAISNHSVQVAPVALAKTVTAVAITKGMAAGGSTLTLIKGALKIMAWTKAKTVIVGSVVVLLAAGTATVTVKEMRAHEAYPWQLEGTDSRVLDRQPPQVRILPSKIKYGSWGKNTGKDGQVKLMGTGVSAENVLMEAYGSSYPVRMVFSVKMPPGKYDYIACLNSGNEETLQNEIRKKFGITARYETQEGDVLFLKIENAGATGLKLHRGNVQTGRSTRENGPGSWSCRNSPLSVLAVYVENYLKVPVIDRTGLTNSFDIDLRFRQSDWGKQNSEGLKQALHDQLGLDLVPAASPSRCWWWKR